MSTPDFKGQTAPHAAHGPPAHSPPAHGPPAHDPAAPREPVAGGYGRESHSQTNEHELDFELPAAPTVSGGKIAAIAAGVLAVGAIAFVVGYLPRLRQRNALAESTQAAGEEVLRVDVVSPKGVSSSRALNLPGSVQSLEETTLYPQANGYIRKWLVDLGDKVKQGQVLVEIDTPELDQQLQQATALLAQNQAQVTQSKANAALSKANLERYEQLTPAGITSKADLDQRQAQAQVDLASVAVADSTVAGQQANIRRLTQLKSFSHVVAPFDGTITQRWAERGALVTTGNSTPLYRLAASDPARVIIQVPQDVVPSVKAGIVANVSVREYPGHPFTGSIARASGELDAVSRTMLTEVRVPNPRSELLPGMYAQVALDLPVPHQVLEVPSTAVITDSRGVQVAKVTPEGKIHLVKVIIERDVGATIEISSGLAEGDRIVKNGGSQLSEGLPVEIAVRPVGSAEGASSAAPKASAAKR